jgi:hypothetical protein
MLPSPAENPERHAFAGELRSLLEWAIDELPEGTREVFMLRQVEGLSTAEVAECLDVSEDVVKTRLSRGRAALRSLLMDEPARLHRKRSASTALAVTGLLHACSHRSEINLHQPAEKCRVPGRASASSSSSMRFSALKRVRALICSSFCHLSCNQHSE